MKHQVATQSLIGIVHTADVTTAAELMVDKNISALGVYSTDAYTLEGIITERDITRIVAQRREPSSTPVEVAMTPDPLIVHGPIGPAEAADAMRLAHVRHLIVKQSGGDHILSLRDL